MEGRTFKFETSSISYENRISKKIWGVAIVCLIVFIIAFSLTTSILALIYTCIAFTFYFLEVMHRSEFHVKSIIIDNNQIDLTYFKKNALMHASMSLDDVDIKLSYVWYKVRNPAPFLDIKLKDGTRIKQHKWGEWDDIAFNRVTKFINRNSNT